MDKIRIDKWLWAARFYKTRSSASQAVSRGQVQANGARVKPSRTIRIGDEIHICRGEIEFYVVILALSEKRGPAKEARSLYEETSESIRARELAREQRRLLADEVLKPTRRPTKKERRQIINFVRKKF